MPASSALVPGPKPTVNAASSGSAPGSAMTSKKPFASNLAVYELAYENAPSFKPSLQFDMGLMQDAEFNTKKEVRNVYDNRPDLAFAQTNADKGAPKVLPLYSNVKTVYNNAPAVPASSGSSATTATVPSSAFRCQFPPAAEVDSNVTAGTSAAPKAAPINQTNASVDGGDKKTASEAAKAAAVALSADLAEEYDAAGTRGKMDKPVAQIEQAQAPTKGNPASIPPPLRSASVPTPSASPFASTLSASAPVFVPSASTTSAAAAASTFSSATATAAANAARSKPTVPGPATGKSLLPFLSWSLRCAWLTVAALQQSLKQS